MTESVNSSALAPSPVFSTRQLVHMVMLVFAFLLPFLTWAEAAGAAMLALLFNLFILPRLDVDLRKRPGGVRAPASGGAEQAWDLQAGIVIYPISVLLLILFYRHSMHVAAAAWAIMALGDGMAGVAGTALGSAALPWNRAKTWAGFCAFVLAGTLGAYALTRWVQPSQPEAKALEVSVATALVGAGVESLAIRLDDNLTVPLVSGAFMYCAYLVDRSALAGNLPFLRLRLLHAVAVCLIFALAALGLRAVTGSGALAGFILSVAVYLGYGARSFLILLAFFVLGSSATRLGYARKAARGVAEGRRGARSWREALANTLAGAFFALLAISTREQAVFLIGLLASFAEAAGDTVSSEIGQWLSDRAYLITTFKPVPAGENGGVSAIGSSAGVAAAGVVVLLGYLLGLCGKNGALLAMAGAAGGNLLDSLLGATLERRGLATNGMVNFAGTSFAGAVAIAVALRFAA